MGLATLGAVTEEMSARLTMSRLRTRGNRLCARASRSRCQHYRKRESRHIYTKGWTDAADKDSWKAGKRQVQSCFGSKVLLIDE